MIPTAELLLQERLPRDGAVARPVRERIDRMAAVDKYLVRRDEHLVQLFTPPFENPVQDPGYIKGYPPGIRENGGQYTHAAIWSAWAFALLGFRLRGSTLSLDPAIPRGWPQFEISFRYRSSTYDILVENPLGVSGGILALKRDRKMLPPERRTAIALIDDGAKHQLHVILG